MNIPYLKKRLSRIRAKILHTGRGTGNISSKMKEEIATFLHEKEFVDIDYSSIDLWDYVDIYPTNEKKIVFYSTNMRDEEYLAEHFFRGEENSLRSKRDKNLYFIPYVFIQNPHLFKEIPRIIKTMENIWVKQNEETLFAKFIEKTDSRVKQCQNSIKYQEKEIRIRIEKIEELHHKIMDLQDELEKYEKERIDYTIAQERIKLAKNLPYVKDIEVTGKGIEIHFSATEMKWLFTIPSEDGLDTQNITKIVPIGETVVLLNGHDTYIRLKGMPDRLSSVHPHASTDSKRICFGNKERLFFTLVNKFDIEGACVLLRMWLKTYSQEGGPHTHMFNHIRAMIASDIIEDSQKEKLHKCLIEYNNYNRGRT